MKHAEHKCGAHHGHGHAHDGTGWNTAASVTLHCLTGCLIGEWVGLAIGVAFALPVGYTVVLATLLAYVSGFALTLSPLLRGGMGFVAALKTVFVGEAVSIGVMEIAMNEVAAAWPVNFWLLRHGAKRCH